MGSDKESMKMFSDFFFSLEMIFKEINSTRMYPIFLFKNSSAFWTGPEVAYIVTVA